MYCVAEHLNSGEKKKSLGLLSVDNFVRGNQRSKQRLKVQCLRRPPLACGSCTSAGALFRLCYLIQWSGLHVLHKTVGADTYRISSSADKYLPFAMRMLIEVLGRII